MLLTLQLVLLVSLTCGFELATRRFELVPCDFELITRGFELVTRVLLFHVINELPLIDKLKLLESLVKWLNHHHHLCCSHKSVSDLI